MPNENDFDEWYRSFVEKINQSLRDFSPRNSPTGDDENWRRYYVMAEGRERFVLHIRPVPTKRRANICIGLPESKLNIPDGFPHLEMRDKSHPDYREFDVPADEPKLKDIAIEIIIQAAEILTSKRRSDYIDKKCRQWIIDIIKNHQSLIALAICQRAKFERWLQFELAAHIEGKGGKSVRVEDPYSSNSSRVDISYDFDGIRYDLELKTINTNWQVDGVENRGRPITKNLAGVVNDAQKLKKSSNKGIVAFVIFPVPHDDRRWKNYIKIIGDDIGINIPVKDYCEVINVEGKNELCCDMVICCFPAGQQPDQTTI